MPPTAKPANAAAKLTSAAGTAGWLEVLAGGADVAVIEEHRARLLAAAKDEAGRADVERAANQALRLHAQLREHRQRLAELGALHELTLRLAGVRNLDALLQDIVTEARRLLDVDVAYLALREPDDSLPIRVTDGSLGPHLRGVVIPPHVGVAGRVVDSGEPVSSIDYLGDAELHHRDDVDRIARTEELRTIAGVPMRLRGDIIGVLMIAQRDVRPPSPNEMSMLGSLASFAAIAIDSARQLEDHVRAAAETAAAHEALRVQAEGTARAATLHERLMDVALSGGGVGKVIEALSEVVQGVVAFADESDVVVAAAQDGKPVAGVTVREVDGAAPSTTFRPLAQRHTYLADGLTTVPVASADSYFGALQVATDDGLDDVARRLLERSALTIALVVASERAVSDAERRTSAEVLEQLLTRRIEDLPGFTRRARSLGLDVTARHVVAVAAVEANRALPVLVGLERHAQDHGGLAARLGGQVVAVVRSDDLDEARAAIAAIAPRTTIGVAGPVAGPDALKQSYDDAAACASVLTALGRDGECAGPEDFGPYRFLLARAGRQDVGRFIERTIGPLIEHDANRGAELVKTADIFLAAGRQHAAASAELNIHPNTLYQRLQRISRLLGEGWRFGDRALDMQMALRLHRLLAGDSPY
ncbi:MAG TPA: GAF domain-containing protein [Mycobacteriales bacterium]|nr:GAF domain-containing protein [Mycobacteriales bacterium]